MNYCYQNLSNYVTAEFPSYFAQLGVVSRLFLYQFFRILLLLLLNLVSHIIPIVSEQECNLEKHKRKRTSKPPREVSTFGDRIEPGPSIEKEEDTPYDIAFIKDTKATTCYGCKGNVRNTAAEPPPPPPYDIFHRHKEFRVYRRRGETKIRISKSLEAVYFHSMRSCAPSASGTNIKMDDQVAGHSQIQTGSCCRANLGFGFN